MRHGLILWREDELSRADVLTRQARLQDAMRRQKLDAVLVYTNHVRSSGVSFLTGFTPYWSDGLLLLPATGAGVFATALSNRVGAWIRANNPTVEVMHSPDPGRLIAEHISPKQGAVVGVVELDQMPRGLIDEIQAGSDVSLVDASDLFAALRAVPDRAELGLARKADDIAGAAFAKIGANVTRIGDVTEALELSVRGAGAEECYVASAPDLATELRLARTKGPTPLGDSYAVRLSVAYNGVWIRRTETFARGEADGRFAELRHAVDRLAESLTPDAALAPQLAAFALPPGTKVAKWSLEAPRGTRPLEAVESNEGKERVPMSYGVLTVKLADERGSSVFARAIGISAQSLQTRSVFG